MAAQLAFGRPNAIDKHGLKARVSMRGLPNDAAIVLVFDVKAWRIKAPRNSQGKCC
jgi:hypothetical protein